MTAARVRTAGMVAAVLAAGLFIIALRVALDGRASLRAARAAEQAGRPELALWHYQSAARAYLPGFLPGGGASALAFDRLFDLGTRAEKRGDRDGARRAFDAFRGAALGARSFYLPHADRVAASEARLAELYADWELAVNAQHHPVGGPRNRAELVRDYARLLSGRPGPKVGTAMVACLACLLWIGAAAGFFRSGLTQDLRLRRGPALLSGICFVAGFAIFVLALRGA